MWCRVVVCWVGRRRRPLARGAGAFRGFSRGARAAARRCLGAEFGVDRAFDGELACRSEFFDAVLAQAGDPEASILPGWLEGGAVGCQEGWPEGWLGGCELGGQQTGLLARLVELGPPELRGPICEWDRTQT